MSDAEAPIDRHVPHAARIYDYMVGGVDHYEVDRAAAHAANEPLPGGFEGARSQVLANRRYLVRVVQHLAGEAGIRQFIDIGTGVPGADNVHAVAHRTAPDARVVYVDNDPTVLAHARELLADDGTTTYIDGDLRHPNKILREAHQHLDFDRPIAVVLNAVLHFLPDTDGPYQVVDQLVAAVPSGSYLAISHLTATSPPTPRASGPSSTTSTAPPPRRGSCGHGTSSAASSPASTSSSPDRAPRRLAPRPRRPRLDAVPRRHRPQALEATQPQQGLSSWS